MKWVGESKTCSRESVAKGLAKGCYNLNKSSGWFLTPLKCGTGAEEAAYDQMSKKTRPD